MILLSVAAHAEDLDLFRPLPPVSVLLDRDEPLGGGFELGYRHVVVEDTESSDALLGRLVSMDLQGWGPLPLGFGWFAEVPVHLAAAGSEAVGHPVPGDARALVISPITRGIAWAAGVQLPSGPKEHWLGLGVPVPLASLLGTAPWGWGRVDAEIGVRGGPPISRGDLHGGARLNADVALTISTRPVSPTLALRAAPSLRPDRGPADVPAVAEAGVLVPMGHLTVRAASQWTLLPGAGAPRFGLMLGARR